MEILHERIKNLLSHIYASQDVDKTFDRILDLTASLQVHLGQNEPYFSEKNVTLITYGDSILEQTEVPLRTLYQFLEINLQDVISTVHILPFYPYSSDDGFSIIDYYQINPQLGTWNDIEQFSPKFRLMFDAVINHMSAESEWFKLFLADEPTFRRLFFTEDILTDLSSVTRPRTSPLLTSFQKKDGSIVHVWTTFSADQVDLDYRSSDTLIRILEVILYYVNMGAQVLRLDAIAYLWKEIGTTCIHLPQTHYFIQLVRAMLDLVAPQVVLITETNVPHAENVSYFGDGVVPEAQLVYNFTLPPLLVYTMISKDAWPLVNWINSLDARSEETAYFNFTASHDGIGVRPVEGILNREQIQLLINKSDTAGGAVSYKSNSDGTQSPYELNITYVDAIIDPDDSIELQARCFLVSQSIMLTLAGIPAVYIHSLLGSRNDIEGLQRTGHNRAINRKKLNVREVLSEFKDPDSLRSQIFTGYTQMIRKRKQISEFHPNAPQRAMSWNNGSVVVVERESLDRTATIRCVHNLTREIQIIRSEMLAGLDVLSDEICSQDMKLAPYQVRWIRLSKPR